MEIITFIGYWIGLPVIIGLLLFGLNAYLLYDVLGKEDNGRKLDSNLLDYMLATIMFPESMIWQLSIKNNSKTKVYILSLILSFTIGFIIVSNYHSGWSWLAALKEILISLLVFGTAKRVWAVYQVYRLYKAHKQVQRIESDIHNIEDQIVDLKRGMKKEEEKAAKVKKAIQTVGERNEQIHTFTNQIHTKIEQHLESHKETLRIMRTNISHLRQWEGKNVRIAIDTNIFMECDDYIIEELKRHKLLISKTVQGEWDYNIKGDDPVKRSKGLRARDRLEELVVSGKQTGNLCEFIVKKWNYQFMKDNNLRTDENDEKIIADYLFEYEKGLDIVILSADKMFTISASIHMPVIRLEKLNLFIKDIELV
ncbi:hypothetical protein SAMN04487944_10875 [Gracilibacillus ureilyticus]|uniref:PIN domain-containing protein n=1 Tax=Gracilibacillus ureilyticus TaxID=531814 RepID=A0A1H9RB07_9BACI|nr:hypothetical protein [Gracilibacillus ureilyticus]SER69239.1 hypothetical protein SAMN04487944_10875 [Gracilibacillus ureilyticus]